MSDQPPQPENSGQVSELLNEVRLLRAEVSTLQRDLEQANRALAATTREQALRLQTAGRDETDSQLPKTVEISDQNASTPSSRLPRIFSNRSEWRPVNALRWDVAALVLILILAGTLRFVDLTTSPLGVQGDEAAVGLEARKVLNDGWIGLYSPAAAGTPTGYYYLAAPFVAVWGDSVLAVRLLSAVLGILTILALYVLLRRNAGFPTAVIGSTLLAVSGWHLIFSRISFLTISWPLIAISGLILLFEGIRSRRWEWWFGAGAVLSLGLYTYNGHSLYVLVLGAFIAWTLFGWRAVVALAGLASLYLIPGWLTIATAVIGLVFLGFARTIRSRSNLECASGFAAGFAIAVYPMARWVISNQDEYFGRGRRLSIFRSEQWTSLSDTEAKVRFLVDRYIEFWNRMTYNLHADTVDTSGVVAIIPEAALILCAIGMVIALFRRNTPLTQLGVLTILVMPVSSVAFTDLALRRALIIAPFVAMFCALAIVEIVRLAWPRPKLIRYGVLTGAAVLIGLISFQNVDGYFNGTNKSRHAEWVLGPDLVQTIDYLNTLPDDSYVYFGSNRWPIGMEIVRFLGPDIVGETRFEPYGPDSTEIDWTKGRPVWILMGPNQDRLAEIQVLYPGGEVVTSTFLTRPNGRPAFIAYLLPVEP